MDTRRLLLFIALSLGMMLLWDKYFAPKSTDQAVAAVATQASPANVSDGGGTNLTSAQVIDVTTDLMKVQINTVGGDVRNVDLLKYADYHDVNKAYKLMLNENGRVFVAQTGLVSNDSNLGLPTHKTIFRAENTQYTLSPDQKELKVSLTSIAESGALEIVKTFTFKRDSYIVDVSYQISNNSEKSLSGVSAYWRFLRDEQAPDGETKFVHTFTGPVYYNDAAKFNAIKFDALAKNDVDYPQNTSNGWAGFTEHYFTGLWLLNPYVEGDKVAPVCVNGVQCRFNFKTVDGNLASAGVLTDLPTIAAHSSYNITVPMYIGPQEYHALLAAAPEVERTKDYGWVYIFATPLFWLLVHIHEFVGNWGWAIILLTLTVKVVLFPLTRASYKSMARMKALSPKIERLKEQYGDDKTKLQQSMMAMYKEEKVNPIGGCLPMILQIPVFIGLYWALLGSVELRQAHFLWINDLSKPDPYYILPVILAVTMFLQTFLNPPAADPMQQKMMRIMPLAFSVMFFFFPAGLVVYWLANNILSMSQQWYVNTHVVPKKK
ncbi:MAG: membrane protein insertase YidC [Burkholderiales bacterium]|nr:membrane protein insertase YidC [Burkholderiales bacterium]